MATQNAPHSQQPAPPRPVLLQGFDGVHGATGNVATCGGQQGPEQDLVGPDDQEERPLGGCADHDAVSIVRARTTEARRASKSLRYVEGVAHNTTSHGGSAASNSRRASSRRRRLIKLRSTDVAPYLGTTMPIRAYGSAFGKARTSSEGTRSRAPERRTRRRSSARVNRARRGKRSDSGASVL
jgi:hypothetical protein